MQVTITRPNITQYAFRFDPKDPIYRNCTWARINLDHEAYTMTAASDCGNYAYSWSVTPTETFIRLMARIDREYLIVFDFDESKRLLLERAKEYAWDDEQLERIEDLENHGAESFYRFCTKILRMDFEDAPVEMRYPVRAVAFAEVFTQYLQPLLRMSATEKETP